MPHPDLDVERAHLARATAARDAMLVRTTAALADASSAATEADSEVSVFHLRRRLESLAEHDGPAAFGRIDHDDERFHVGRRHIEDAAGDPLVVDWRAPVSVPFYRATAHDPLGLARRRRFLSEGATLVDILEEDFSDPEGTVLSGAIPDPLLADLERERSGTMRDIVATIAGEQDEVIRAPLDRLLVVQGGPGTGKTAVALHRAAFLLFEHRDLLLDRGVLVIGPNEVFLRYVADVLPSLGETAVRQTTIEGLRPPSIGLDPEPEAAEVEVLKGDRRMVGVIRAAIRSSIRLPDEAVSLPTPWGTVHLEAGEVAEAVGEILGRDVPHATGKESLRNLLLHRAYATHERVAEVPALKTRFMAAARTDKAFGRFLDRVWPSISASALVHRLLRSRTGRRRAAEGLLEPGEVELLARDVPGRVGDTRWRPADVALLDEAEAQLRGPRITYGHVIVDEAQDLSSMALRMVARRADRGSLTIVGDLAQATRPSAQHRWEDATSVLQGQAPVQHVELTVGYRTPAPVLDFANRLLPWAAPEVSPARSIHASGHAPVLRDVEPAEVPSAVAQVVAEILSAEGRGTVGIVAVSEAHAGIGQALDGVQVDWASGGAGLGSVALLTPLLAKGLEFDHVVVVEPEAIVRREPAGLRALFVALTRPTTSLVVVHAAPLPEQLAG